MTLQSNADLRFLNGLLPVSSVSWPVFLFLILLLLMSICTHFHLLFWPYFRFPNSFFKGDSLSANPNLEGQSTIFITPGQGDSSIPPGTGYPF
jgi:hypothetical protein